MGATAGTPGGFGDHQALACSRPVVASRAGGTAQGISRHRRDFPDRLVASGDAAALAGALVSALDPGAVDYGPQLDWGAAGAELAAALQRIGGRSGLGLSLLGFRRQSSLQNLPARWQSALSPAPPARGRGEQAEVLRAGEQPWAPDRGRGEQA